MPLKTNSILLLAQLQTIIKYLPAKLQEGIPKIIQIVLKSFFIQQTTPFSKGKEKCYPFRLPIIKKYNDYPFLYKNNK